MTAAFPAAVAMPTLVNPAVLAWMRLANFAARSASFVCERAGRLQLN